MRFADSIDTLVQEEHEINTLVESLGQTCTRYKIQSSTEKAILMTNSASGVQREIKVKRQKLDTEISVKHLGVIVYDAGSKQGVLSRIEQTSSGQLQPI
ncbi:MAG: hypothetical protein AB2693_29785 [Candidatus Thiodiazotropha sp.]